MKNKRDFLIAALGLFLFSEISWAGKPRDTQPTSPDAIYQNDTDLWDSIRALNSDVGAIDTTPPELLGEIRMWPTTTAPTGWYICDGTAKNRTTDAALFAVIGTTFGVGDGSTTFNLPDFRRRVPVGSGGTGTATLDDLIGSTGGAETHTLTINEMPQHDHDETARIGAAGGANIAVRADGSADTNEDATYNNTGQRGGGAAHNNMQPSLVINFIIRYQ